MDIFRPGLSQNKTLSESLKAVQENPRSLQFLHLAESYRQEGFLSQALAICDEGLEHHPGMARAYLIKAECFFDLRKYADCLRLIEKILMQNPENGKAIRLEAKVFERLGQASAAYEAYRKLLRIFPNDQDAIDFIEVVEMDRAKKRASEVDRHGAFATKVPLTSGRLQDFSVMVPGSSFFTENDYLPKESAGSNDLVIPIQLDGEKETQKKEKNADLSSSLTGEIRSVVDPEAEATIKSKSVDYCLTEDDQEPIFATKTIAELYLRQGMIDKAVSILRKILIKDPANDWAIETLRQLTEQHLMEEKLEEEGSFERRSLLAKAAFLERLSKSLLRKRTAQH